MNQDALNYLQPQGTYRYAKNMVKGDRHALGYGLSTEESDTEVESIGEVVGAYYVESINSTVLFVLPGSIYLFDHETEKATFVASDSEFGCDWKFSSCEYISATFKTDQPCNELKAYFSSGCEFFVVNITELQNPVRKAGLIESIKNKDNTFCELTCDHFKIFKCVCAPTITPITSDRGGHRLVSGTYQFVAQLEDNGGNKTNWFRVSDPVSVASENNQPGELSLSSIKVHITDLDCRYDKVNIAVIQTVEGINTAQIVATRHYNTDGITFTYTGQTGREISLLEIQSKRKMWLQGRDVAQKDSRLFLYNIRQQKNLNMQRRVLEEAKLSFQMTEVTPKMVEMHGMRTLIRDENYMFGVVYNYCDGTHSNAFVMRPNPVDGCGGGSVSSGSFTEPSGKAQEYFRPRGGNTGDGAPVGCASGNCGGGSAGGGGLENRGTGNTEEEQNEESTIIESWSTEVPNMVEAAKCDDCQEPHCCQEDDEGNVACIGCGENSNCAGCEQDEIAYENDLPKLQNLFTLHTDQITNENQDNTTDVTSTDFITAAKNLIDSIDNSEFHKIKKENFDINVVTGGGSGGAGSSTEAAERGTGNSGSSSSTMWSDEFTNGKGEYLLEDTPKVVGCFAPKVQTSVEKYPDSKDCDGEYLFGSFANQNVQLFRTPSVEEAPIVTATATGVPSPHSSTQPTDSVMINLLGVIAQVPEPSEEDLPKPLCPNNPWTLVIIPRDEINSTVQAKGIGFGTMTGQSAGDTLIYGRHAANSRTNVERWIDNGGSRKGSTDGPGMFFYGLDTEIGKAGLSGRTFRDEGLFRGMGYRYGLYEEGQKPAEALTGRRVDQRGATQAINLNILQPRRSENNISAIGYLNANKVTSVQGAQHKVCTLHRESCVYIDAGINIPTDSSFTTDTLDHSCPIPNAHGVYGAVVREIEDQYGAITGMSFVKSGLEGRGFRTYQGVIGDSFIGPYTFVRQSFVSDKVGNTYNTPERVRTVCDSPNDLVLQNLGIDFHSTQLPLSGDRSDAKNWAGGHEDTPWAAAHGVEPEFDYYYPKTQRTLITTWVESRINPFLRATGYGDPEKTVEVFYPKLKGLNTAASESTSKHPWEKSFLNLFIHYRVEQPSVAQLTRLAIVRNIIFFVIPMLGLDKLGDITGVADGVGTMLTFPLLYAYWYAMKNLITRNDYLHKMLGLPVCKTDDAGGENDNAIEGFRNNYYAYNYDHSALNYANVYQAIPANYNTCSCSLCTDDATTNEIYYSNKQIQGSPIDFYKQFGALSFESLPHDLGKLRKLFTVNGNFFAHTEDFIIPLNFKDISNGAVTVQNSAMGGYLTFSEPDSPLFEGIQEGMLGNTDPNAAINTPMGYLFVDREARKIYLFDGVGIGTIGFSKGGGPAAISSIGMDRFFKEYLNFCSISDCHDEKNESGTYYTMGYDPRYNRVLFTKKDGVEKGSFTLSLDLSTEEFSWVSFHDYVPKLYFNDRANIFNIKDGKIYKQNTPKTYRNFHGTEFASEIEFVAVAPDGESFTYENTVINTEAEKENRRNLDITFNKIAAYNTTQGTGTLDTIVIGDNKDSVSNMNIKITENGKIKLNKVKRSFRFNNIKDNTKPSCKEEAIILSEECNPIPTINESIFDCSPPQQQSFKNTVLVDDHITYRMTFDQDDKTIVKLLSVKTEGDKEIR